MIIFAQILGFVGYLAQLLIYVILIYVVLSWLVAFNVINVRNEFVRTVMVGIERLLEPIMRPIRRILPDLGGIDLSPMVVILGLIFLTDYLIPGVQQYLMAQ